jgi:PAS domain-containing protein
VLKSSNKSQREKTIGSRSQRSPSKPAKAADAGVQPLAALSRVIAALQPNTELILAQKKQLEELNARFEIALNNMGRGLSTFDAQARLIVCNRLYRAIYNLPEELTRPGTSLAEIVRYHVKMETGRDDPAAVEKQRKWIAKHVAELARGKSFSHTQYLKSGRIVLVSNQPLPCGGWVDIQEDITRSVKPSRKSIGWHATIR